MKQILFLIFLQLALVKVFGQKPEPVYGFARVEMPIGFYKEQAIAWKKVIDKNQKDGKAWQYYYRANRNIMRRDPAEKRTEEEKQAFMKNLLKDMGKAIPNSYELNLVNWMEAGNNFSKVAFLKKADELGPNRIEHIEDLMVWAEYERDIPKRNNAGKRWVESGNYSAGMLSYNYNVMMGAPKNAILLTAGDNDTFPAWILQSQGIRNDVTVINSSLLIMDKYRSAISKELGLPDMNLGTDEKGMISNEGFENYNKNMVIKLAENKKGYPVYVTLTAASNPPLIERVEGQLFLTGLGYLFSKETVDNIALLRHNFEHIYAMDYVNHAFYTEISPAGVKTINRNYEIPMLKLFEHYKASGDAGKQTWIREKLLTVSKGTEEEESIRQLVN